MEVSLIIHTKGLILILNPMLLALYSRNEEMEKFIKKYLQKMYLGELTIPIYVIISPILYVIEEIIIFYQCASIQNKFRTIQVNIVSYQILISKEPEIC